MMWGSLVAALLCAYVVLVELLRARGHETAALVALTVGAAAGALAGEAFRDGSQQGATYAGVCQVLTGACALVLLVAHSVQDLTRKRATDETVYRAGSTM